MPGEEILFQRKYMHRLLNLAHILAWEGVNNNSFRGDKLQTYKTSRIRNSSLCFHYIANSHHRHDANKDDYITKYQTQANAQTVKHRHNQ